MLQVSLYIYIRKLGASVDSGVNRKLRLSFS